VLLNDALNQIIDDGIETARADYLKSCDIATLNQRTAGFEACRGKTADQIAGLLAQQNRLGVAPGHREAVIWVAEVLSCIMLVQGWKPICEMMSATAHMKAANIIGVDDRET
jgi:hypothetical protein